MLAWDAGPPDLGALLADDYPFLGHLLRLSVILARVLHHVYGPTGVKAASNQDILGIKSSLDEFTASLPLSWRFDPTCPERPGGESLASAALTTGLLHLLHTGVTFLLLRPFMRFSFIVPSHFTLNMDIPNWASTFTAARQSIDFASTQSPADLFPFGMYAFHLSAIVAYHAWARRRDFEGLLALETAAATSTRWSSDHPAIPLLRSLTAAAHPTFPTDPSQRGLDPTPGILNRLPETSIAGITFLRDPSHPRGGVLVATRQAAKEIKDLPEGTVIIGGPVEVDTASAEVFDPGQWEAVSLSFEGS